MQLREEILNSKYEKRKYNKYMYFFFLRSNICINHEIPADFLFCLRIIIQCIKGLIKV